MNYRDERETYQEFLEQRRREEEEQNRRAAEELARAVFSGHEVRGTTVLGGAPVVPSPEADDAEASGADAEADGTEKRVGSADAGAHGIRPSRKRTAGEELYRIIEGHDHDNVVNSLYDVDRSDPQPGA